MLTNNVDFLNPVVNIPELKSDDVVFLANCVIAESDGYFGDYTIIDFCVTNGGGNNAINNIETTVAPLDKAVLQRSKSQKNK